MPSSGVPVRALVRRIAIVVGSAGLLVGCGGNVPPAERAATSAPRSGTQQMVDTLQRLTDGIIAGAEYNGFLNRERGEAITKILATAQGGDRLTLRLQLANEKLRYGDTRGAIRDLEALLRETNLSWNAITPQVKPLFDLLAVAYLRLGEQENCADNMAANVCILPLAAGARHTKTEGARNAIRAYGALLQQFPEERASQWLLNLAYLQLGLYPDSVPRAQLIPNLTSSAGVSFPVFPNVAGSVGLGHVGLSGGVSIADFTGDGLLDVFTTAFGLRDPVRLSVADGHGGYTERIVEAGLGGLYGGLNTIHADYDNDGHEDVVVLRGAWLADQGQLPFSLLRNCGDGTFEDVTIASGLFTLGPTNTAAWADYDLDGALDLFVGYESGIRTGAADMPSRLFHNNRDGTFTEVSQQVGLVLDDYVKGVAWSDVNDDGLPDLFASVMNGPKRLFLNRGATAGGGWRFEDVSARSGIGGPLASFPAMFFDVDDDGRDDLLVLSYDFSGQPAEVVAREYLGMPLRAITPQGLRPFDGPHLYRNVGGGRFEDITARAGLAGKAVFGMGTNFGDLDNDGWLDVYVGTGNPDYRASVPNRMFHNLGGRRFEEVTLPGGFGHLQKGHGTAFADLDRDGDEDVFMVIGGAYEGDVSASVLFENPGWPGRHSVTLLLEGRTANRSAIGARVTVRVKNPDGRERTLHRTVGTGGTFGAGPLDLHVGLGPATQILDVQVQWPDRARSVTHAGPLDLDAAYRLVQGEAPVKLDRPAVPFRRAGPPATMAMP